MTSVFAKSVKYWITAIRPKTLSISMLPVLVGNSLGWAENKAFSLLVMTLTLSAAVMIQIGTNLYNDVADFERGADNQMPRLGPPRVTAQGWLSAAEVRYGALASFSLAVLFSCYLIVVGGWPIALVGVASIWAGWAYTGGSKPIAYIGGGELFVLIFFGIVAVTGSYYLQSGQVAISALALGIVIGFPAAAVLVVNNYRDIEGDKLAGKNTLAVRMGRTATKAEYAVFLMIPYILLRSLDLFDRNSLSSLIPFFTLPWAVFLIWRFCHEKNGNAFNQLLLATTLFHAVFGIAICISLIISF